MRAACPLLLTLVVHASAARAGGPILAGPDTVTVHSGALQLRALLWRPAGHGPFPAVLLNVGSGRNPQLGAETTLPGPPRYGAVTAPRITEARPQVLGPVFAKHGYVFLVLFRRGQGLSADQGTYSGDSLDRERAANGVDAANHLQVRLLETELLDDARAGVAFLRALPEVDPHRVAAVGHSFGGSLTLFLAERDSTLRAAVVFSAAGNSWARSQEMRTGLLAAVGRTSVPTFFIHAANDYSIEPGQAMAAEKARLGEPERVRIYPALGKTADEAHSFIYLAVPTWEADVFGFLDEHLRR